MDTFTKVIYRLLTIGSWVSLMAGAITLCQSWLGHVIAADYWSVVILVDLTVMCALFLTRVGYGLVRRLSVKR